MKTTLLSILVLTLISCDASMEEFVGSSWKVVELNDNGTSVEVTNDVMLKVNSDTKFSLKLDVNNCFGSYTITGKNDIKIEGLGCTEMCCDSKFSRAVTTALYKVSKINLKGNIATLSSEEVEIKFERQKIVSEAEKNVTENNTIIVNKEKTPIKETMNIGRIENPNTVDTPTGEYIELYKSPCKGSCEEYNMKFYEDGTVLYTGKFNAQVQGKHSVQLTASKSKSLFSDFEQSNFMSFQDKYDDEKLMDLQETHLTYKGKKINIRFVYEAPQDLQDLLKKVETQADEALQKLKKK
ncbi:MAG: DUF6438 domain-containing protein [Bacteroidota bacterium]